MAHDKMPPTAEAEQRIRGIGIGKIAESVEVSRVTVRRWLDTGIPGDCVLGIERATGIPRAELRPDLFGKTTA